MEINWATGEITVYKTDSFMTFVGGNVYNMDTNRFRLALKDLEDDPVGMTFPDTHRHNTTVLLGGIEYARILEILAPYTITFSDAGGGWVCNLIGSNNNILDKANLTTVQIRSNNSAGLVQTAEIQYGVFGGGVTVDVTASNTGTVYPVGTPLQPVNNFIDAVQIALFRGFEDIYIHTSCTFDATVSIDEFHIHGRSGVRTAIDILPAAQVMDCVISDCAVSGTLDGGTLLERCVTSNLTYINGLLDNCMLNPGTIELGGDSSEEAHFLQCYAGRGEGPTVDCAGDGPALYIREYSGTVTLTNKTGNAPVIIDLSSGLVVLDSTVTSGVIRVRGVGEIKDTFGNQIPTGMWNGCTIVNGTVTSNSSIADAVIAAAQATPIHADTRKMNGATVYGDGTSGNKWRGA